MKTCTNCNKTFEDIETNFYHHPQGKDGYRSMCKECLKEKAREKSRKTMKDVFINREKIKAKRKELGLTIEEAAKLIGIPYHTYLGVEIRDKRVRRNTWEKINKVYKLEG